MTLPSLSANFPVSIRMYLRWEERVERASTEMEVLHETEQPRPLVAARLPQSLHHADRLGGIADSVTLHTCMSEFTLAWVEPARGEWGVGKHEETPDGDQCGHGSFAVDRLARCMFRQEKVD